MLIAIYAIETNQRMQQIKNKYIKYIIEIITTHIHEIDIIL